MNNIEDEDAIIKNIYNNLELLKRKLNVSSNNKINNSYENELRLDKNVFSFKNKENTPKKEVSNICNDSDIDIKTINRELFITDNNNAHDDFNNIYEFKFNNKIPEPINKTKNKSPQLVNMKNTLMSYSNINNNKDTNLDTIELNSIHTLINKYNDKNKEDNVFDSNFTVKSINDNDNNMEKIVKENTMLKKKVDKLNDIIRKMELSYNSLYNKYQKVINN